MNLVSESTCIDEEPLREVFLQDSDSSADCAKACSTTVVDGPWLDHSFLDSRLRFRCTDNDLPMRTDSGGFTYMSDASMITTLNNASYRDYNFGIGAGEGDDWVDWDQTAEDGGDASDNTQILVYGR